MMTFGCLSTSSVARIREGAERATIAASVSDDGSQLHWKATRMRLVWEPFTTTLSGSLNLPGAAAGCASSEFVTPDSSRRWATLPLGREATVVVGYEGLLPPTLQLESCEIAVVFRPQANASGLLLAIDGAGESVLGKIPPEHSTSEPLLWLNLFVSPIADPLFTPIAFVTLTAAFASLEP